MEVNIEKTGPCVRRVSVVVPVTAVNKAFDAAYRDVGKSANIPGFRPGKAPKAMLERHYGSTVRSEVQQRLVSDTLFRAIEKASEAPVGMPKIEPGELTRGTAFQYVAEFEVQPPVTLTTYKGLQATNPNLEVPDAEVDAQLEEMRKQASQLVPVLIRDVAQDGDVVVIDYEGTIGGAPLPGGKGENALVELGGETYLPGFSEGLVGAKVPSERQVPVTFPADYSVKDVAGKQATFHVKVKELKTKELPKLDDEFAKDVGAESLAALRDKTRGELLSRKQDDVKMARRHSVLTSLIEKNPFDLAPSMVTSQAERMVQGAAQRVQQLMGRSITLSDKELAALRKDSEKDAEFQVRSGLLLLEVAKAEKLEVAPAEIDAELERIAKEAGETLERVQAFYGADERKDSLRFKLLEEKTVMFLLESSVDSGPAEPEIDAKKKGKK